MSRAFNDALARLRGVECRSIDAIEFKEPPTDSIYSVGTTIVFADGTRVSAQFWRLLKDGQPLVSIFDHRQKYGLPAPVDAFAVLSKELGGRPVEDAGMAENTRDLRFRFTGELELEVFNFTAFEIWEVAFPDGKVEFSNHALTT